MNMANLTMLASVMASLVAVPAVSTSMSSDVTAAGALVSGTSEEAFSDAPRQFSTTVGTDKVEKTIKTSAGEASFTVSDEAFTAVLDRAGEQTTLAQRAGTMERRYEGNGVALRTEAASTTETVTCETPDGKLTKEHNSGAVTESFDGVDRQAVESQCENARETLQKRAEKLAAVAMELDVVQRQVEITRVNASKEVVELTNNAPIPINMTGWTISDGSGTEHTISNAVLETGERMKIYSADAYDSCTEHCWSSTYVWSQDGDTAILEDTNGDRVDTYSYGG